MNKILTLVFFLLIKTNAFAVDFVNNVPLANTCGYQVLLDGNCGIWLDANTAQNLTCTASRFFWAPNVNQTSNISASNNATIDGHRFTNCEIRNCIRHASHDGTVAAQIVCDDLSQGGYYRIDLKRVNN